MKAQKRFFDGKSNDSNKMLTLLAAFHKEADETRPVYHWVSHPGGGGGIKGSRDWEGNQKGEKEKKKRKVDSTKS